MSNIFLKAEWRKLILANYEVDEAILKKYLPKGTEPDTWNGHIYVSLVGFMFKNTKVRGIPVPFHRHFEEINLRFYVKRPIPDQGIKRGVVFIKEIVPKKAISLVANVVYNEPYVSMQMDHKEEQHGDTLTVSYGCRNGKWHNMEVKALNTASGFKPGSEEEFITEHYWGYTRMRNGETQEYGVEHPSWKMYPVTDYACSFDFGALYGKDFESLNNSQPRSVFLAEGSDILVRSGTPLN